MENLKIKDLLQNGDFMKKICEMEKPEDVQKAFKEKGIDISLEEVNIFGNIINKRAENGGKPLTKDELAEIAGGDDPINQQPTVDTTSKLKPGFKKAKGGVHDIWKNMSTGQKAGAGIGVGILGGAGVLGTAATAAMAIYGGYDLVKKGVHFIKSRKK